MSRLLWDQVGERFYEAGVDRGVLYLADGSGVSWNGLISVEEGFGGDSTTPVYFDGVKQRDAQNTGDFEATINAFTYPDQFLDYEGLENLGNGLFVDDQPAPLAFGLSYRTMIGSDLDNVGRGYRIHIIYNLTATPSASSFETIGADSAPLEFSWDVTSVPEPVAGFRATAHVIFDSRFLNKSLLEALENILYGTTDSDPRIPAMDELFDLVASWDPRFIFEQPNTGLSNLRMGLGDLTQGIVRGIFVRLATTRLVETSIAGLYRLDRDINPYPDPEPDPDPDPEPNPVGVGFGESFGSNFGGLFETTPGPDPNPSAGFGDSFGSNYGGSSNSTSSDGFGDSFGNNFGG